LLFVQSAGARDESLLATSTKQGDERLSKLLTHCAKQNEVHCTVDESQDVEQIAKVQKRWWRRELWAYL